MKDQVGQANALLVRAFRSYSQVKILTFRAIRVRQKRKQKEMEHHRHHEDDDFFDIDDADMNVAKAMREAMASGGDAPMTSPNSAVCATHIFSPLPGSRLSDNDRLERSGQWLQSIPRDDVIALQQTLEYQNFLIAFDKLGQAHRKVVGMNRSLMSLEDSTSVSTYHPLQGSLFASSFSFLQHLAVDDVILRVFEFLECHSLIRLSRTCSRFRELAYRSATQRTIGVANARQLNNVMKLLRAKEQIDGVSNNIHDSHVRVPMLGLSRRIYVTEAGDPEYNGVYYCTGNSGNGFVFTKPRYPERRIQALAGTGETRPDHPMLPAIRRRSGLPGQQQGGDDNDDDNYNQEGLENEIAKPGQILRCIIAKRFSREVRCAKYWVLFCSWSGSC